MALIRLADFVFGMGLTKIFPVKVCTAQKKLPYFFRLKKKNPRKF